MENTDRPAKVLDTYGQLKRMKAKLDKLRAKREKVLAKLDAEEESLKAEIKAALANAGEGL